MTTGTAAGISADDATNESTKTSDQHLSADEVSPLGVTAGSAAICRGTVTHHRTSPVEHRFTYPVTMIWLDPDEPTALTERHPLWSADRHRPVRFRRRDYFDGGVEPIGPALRQLVYANVGVSLDGPIRMLSQPRTWGWLFNPITIYLLWADRSIDEPTSGPSPKAAVIEVTNTPWKERHRYVVALAETDSGLVASFDKALHVSPFLGQDHRYQLRISEAVLPARQATRLVVDLDVLPRATTRPTESTTAEDEDASATTPVLTTRLVVDRHRPTRQTMTAALLTNPAPTHIVSSGIHRQAVALWRSKVPFVPHPRRQSIGRRVVAPLLERIDTDQLTIVDGSSGATSRYGQPSEDAELLATIVVNDRRAWSALVTQGSIGFGRGYLEGWWTSDDPTTVVRIAIRNLARLDDARNRVSRLTSPVTDRVRRVLPYPDRRRNRKDIAAHYDIGNEFFALLLDDTMTYSAGVFDREAAPMADASIAKYDRLIAKLGITADHDVLEIGTGWAGFALHAASTVGCQVTTTTVSAEQRREAEARVRYAGLEHLIVVRGDDWRDLSGTYDRIVSIEMIEAVDWRSYQQFFRRLEGFLSPTGLIGLQSICVPDHRYERTKNTEDFIRRFVFPGGQLPSLGALNRAMARTTKLQLLDVEDLSAHYAETLRRWRAKFDAAADELDELGLDERFRRLWRFYLAYCEAAFVERHCTVNQVVLAGNDWRPDGLTLRPC